MHASAIQGGTANTSIQVTFFKVGGKQSFYYTSRIPITFFSPNNPVTTNTVGLELHLIRKPHLPRFQINTI